MKGPIQSLPWTLDRDGVQVYQSDLVDYGQGWGAYTCTCPMCDHFWIAVAPAGMAGRECPRCGYTQWQWIWSGECSNDCEEHRS